MYLLSINPVSPSYSTSNESSWTKLTKINNGGITINHKLSHCISRGRAIKNSQTDVSCHHITSLHARNLTTETLSSVQGKKHACSTFTRASSPKWLDTVLATRFKNMDWIWVGFNLLRVIGNLFLGRHSTYVLKVAKSGYCKHKKCLDELIYICSNSSSIQLQQLALHIVNVTMTNFLKCFNVHLHWYTHVSKNKNIWMLGKKCIIFMISFGLYSYQYG